jgi:hypothetical protein
MKYASTVFVSVSTVTKIVSRPHIEQHISERNAMLETPLCVAIRMSVHASEQSSAACQSVVLILSSSCLIAVSCEMHADSLH